MRRKVVTLVCGVGLWACGGEPSAPVDHASRRAAYHAGLKERLADRWDAPDSVVLAGADPAAGKEIYGKSCGPCHGTRLDGRGPRAGGLDPRPPALVEEGAAELPAAAWLLVVTEGVPGTAMAPWGRAFTDDQIRDVVAFARGVEVEPSR